jgi:gas vesicle protein
MNKTGVFFGGLLAGAVIGAAIGILYAPKSGKDTRDQLKNKLGDMEDELNRLKEKAKSKGLELKDEIKHKVTDLENRIEKLVNEYRKTVDTEQTA